MGFWGWDFRRRLVEERGEGEGREAMSSYWRGYGVAGKVEEEKKIDGVGEIRRSRRLSLEEGSRKEESAISWSEWFAAAPLLL